MDESTWRFGFYTVVWPNNNIIFSLGLLIFWPSASEVTTLLLLSLLLLHVRGYARVTRVSCTFTRAIRNVWVDSQSEINWFGHKKRGVNT